jgi:5-methylcytosine-specific restriction endonuclease McrA
MKNNFLMTNRWGIPKEIELLVLNRDLTCVYCGITFNDSEKNRRTGKTWEHIINDIRINGSENIALCCGSCNASKGNKKLEDWLKSKYCLNKNINQHSVSIVVKKHLEKTTTSTN